MLTYLQVHLYYLVPPICVLLAVYWPVLGRRDGLKMLFLATMATIWTTPWDNWILSRSGWGYPPDSVLFRIGYVPIEEHAFFILHPIFLILLHSIISHPDILPFRIASPQQPLLETSLPTPSAKKSLLDQSSRPALVQTLARKPARAMAWMAVWVLGLLFVHEAHRSVGSESLLPIWLQYGGKMFYLGWILAWITPVIAFITYLGADFGDAERKTFVFGASWLCAIDTIAIRNGAWFISQDTTTGYEVVRGLPLEECLFFLLVSYLLVISAQLISHLHTLLFFAPDHPPCPPLNPFTHIKLLLDIALHPPRVNSGALWALIKAEETLRAGSKSFDVAKLAFGREMRIGLVAVYAWSRVTDNLIDESHNLPPAASKTTSKDPSPDPSSSIQEAIVESIYDHLRASYRHTTSSSSASSSDAFAPLRWIPDFTEEMAGAFHLFATLIPRLVPIDPFEQLIRGYETDLKFPNPLSPEEAMGKVSPVAARLADDPHFKLEEHLPIRTNADLMQYADDVAGSTASEICFLAWSILTYSSKHPLVPRKEYESWCDPRSPLVAESSNRGEIVESAREMGRALQLVNIARDIVKDALMGRLYIPLSSFESAKEIVQVLIPRRENSTVDYAKYNIPLLDMADKMRARADPAIKRLPRTARGGTRAMLASYFVIGDTIRAASGRIDERGIKVNKVRRVWAAAKALWLGL